MIIISEMGKALVADATRMLKSAEDYYEFIMNIAISTLKSARSDIERFGIDSAIAYDGLIEDRIKLVIDAEKYYNNAKEIYDDIIIRFVW